MSKLLYSKKFWLLVVYPLAAAFIGIFSWLLNGWFFPDYPNPARNGFIVAALIAAFWYVHAWVDHRKKRRERV